MAKFASQPVTMLLQDAAGQDVFWRGSAAGASTSARASNAPLGADMSLVFANSALINTPVPSPAIAIASGGAANVGVFVANPSLVTALTARVYVSQTISSVVRWGLLTSFTVPASPDNFNPDQTNKVSSALVLVAGSQVGENLMLVLSNNTALGVADIFVALARIREA